MEGGSIQYPQKNEFHSCRVSLQLPVNERVHRPISRKRNLRPCPGDRNSLYMLATEASLERQFQNLTTKVSMEKAMLITKWQWL